MNCFDVVVVGGGPGGSACGWKLRQAGRSVLVVDKKQFPRDKPCAGWITPQVAQSLCLDLDAYADGHVCQPIYGFRCGTIDGRHVVANYPQPISYGIRRCEFDTFLLGRSAADCELGTPVESIHRRDGVWEINGRFSAKMLVGAGGHFCPVSRLLGARNDSPAAVVVAQEIEFKLDAQQPGTATDAQVPELYFCKDLQGYGWCVRKGNYLNIGLGRTDAQRLSTHVQRFCEFLQKTGRVWCDIPSPFVGHAYQLYERTVPKLLDDGVLLVGDAAGLAYPHSGEGIRPAVESGLIAADVILRADGKYRKEDLAPYASQLVARFGKPRQQSFTGWLPAVWLQSVAARLLGTRWFCQDVVLDRWFLHRQQDALAI